jgi:hypothetical protein
LASLLGSLYKRDDAVIGFQDRAGTILPLTVVCTHPDVFQSTETYDVLFSTKDRPALTQRTAYGIPLAEDDVDDAYEEDEDDEAQNQVC